MKVPGQSGKIRPSSRPEKKADKGGSKQGDKKRRNALGNPLLWVAPVILIALLIWALLSGLGGYRASRTTPPPSSPSRWSTATSASSST